MITEFNTVSGNRKAAQDCREIASDWGRASDHVLRKDVRDLCAAYVKSAQDLAAEYEQKAERLELQERQKGGR